MAQGLRVLMSRVASGPPTCQDVLRSRLLKDTEMTTRSCPEIHSVNFLKA